MPTARTIVESEVRELVRRRELDPVADPTAVSALIDEAVADYLDRATTSQLPPLADRPGVVARHPRRDRRVRAAAALPRRSRDRRDLDQRAGPGVRRPPRTLRTDHAHPHRRRGRRTRRADAAHHRAPHRPQHPVRRRDAARRIAPARRHPVHHPPPHGGEHPQVRARPDLARRTRRRRLAHRPGRALPRSIGRRRAEHPRRRRHAVGQDHDAQRAVRRDPRPRTRRHRRGGLRTPDCRFPTSSACRPASPTSKAPARSRCAGW